MGKIVLQIDPEFSALIPPLTKDEFEQLEKNIMADGCRDSIVAWKGVIIDGHNRYKICNKHGIDFRVKSMNFECREDAIIWICENQRGRRNIHSEQWDYLLGKEYEMTKRKVGNPNFSQLDQIGQIGNSSKSTRKILVEKHGLSEGTIQRSQYFAKGVDAIGEVSPKAKEKILSGESKLTKGLIQNVRNMSEQEVKTLAKGIEKGIKVEPPKKPRAKRNTLLKECAEVLNEVMTYQPPPKTEEEAMNSRGDHIAGSLEQFSVPFFADFPKITDESVKERILSAINKITGTINIIKKRLGE